MFLFALTIVLLPHVFIGQTFLPFGCQKYYIERNNTVTNYLEAEKKCKAINATLAVVNTEYIRNFLVKQIGNLTSKRKKVVATSFCLCRRKKQQACPQIFPYIFSYFSYVISWFDSYVHTAKTANILRQFFHFLGIKFINSTNNNKTVS